MVGAMQNHYPIWKYLLLIVLISGACIYALPNVYPEEPAVQISHSSGDVGSDGRQMVEQQLSENGIGYKSIEKQAGILLIRFVDTDVQLQAADVLRLNLPDRYITALNLASVVPEWLARLGADAMNLGLDLRGGVYFLLAVDSDAALSKALARYQDELSGIFYDKKLYYRKVAVEKDVVSIVLRDAEIKEKVVKLIQRDFPRVFVLIDTLGNQITLRLSEVEIKKTIDFAVQQNIITLRKRVNEIGVAEPIVTRQGQDRIAVQLPGVQNTAEAKEILGATATLEFRMVAEGYNPEKAHKTGRVPARTKLYYKRDGTPVLLKKKVMITGEYITSAASGFDDQTGSPTVHITLDGTGARLFSQATAKNIQRPMAVVFIENKVDTIRDADGKLKKRKRTIEEVINVATIQAQLSKRFQITGLDSSTEARKLALLLRAGALAAPLEIVEERTVGPSLGKDNIAQGVRSIILAFILVILFMGIYYRVFGLIANLALTTNIILIIAAMSLIPGATLTLPGIVGIVLTVGMAVDANVLIFERIREELKSGNSSPGSIDAGYRQALSTIADANITTLIAAIVLFVFGTGPIKGFAVTLSIGILCSMLTAIVGTRAIVNLIYGNKKDTKLLI